MPLDTASTSIRKEKPFKLTVFDSVSPISVAMAIRHMSIMLRSGISLDNTVKIMSDQAETPTLRKVFAELHNSIQKGISLAESMKRFPTVFSPIIVSIIDIGEQGGGLDQNLLFLSDYLKKKYELAKKVSGALLYPLIVFFMTGIEMGGVIFFLLPKLESLFAAFRGDSPGYVLFIMAATRFIRFNWYWLLLGGVVLTILLMLFLRTEAGKRFYSKLSLAFPILNNVVKLEILTSISRTIGILMSNSIPLVRAVRTTAETTSNVVYREVLFAIAKEVESGTSLASNLEKYKRLFPETFVKLIELGESSGSLEENLRYLHGFYSDELQDLTSNMASLIEPLLMIFIGIMIGFLALMIIGPIYSLTSSINN